MSDQILFGNTVLKGINKAGTLKPDKDGYYPVVLGAIGIINSANEKYIDTPAVRAMFEQNSTLMRRLGQGLLRGEWGHPKPGDYPNFMAFERRSRMIDEDKICCHIREVWLEEIMYMNQPVMGIHGKVRPSGPYGPALKSALDNPHENVTFSGRYYSHLGVEGNRRTREIHTVATWDFVSEPGVAQSQKYLSPSLESFDDTVLSDNYLTQAVAYEESHADVAMSMESSGMSAKDLMRDMSVVPKATATPKRFDW